MGQVQGFGQRNETDAEMRQFLRRAEQVSARAAPAIGPTSTVSICRRRAASSSFRPALRCAGAHFLDLHHNGPTTPCRVLQSTILHWESLLVVQWTRAHTSAKRSFPPANPPGQKPCANRLGGRPVFRALSTDSRPLAESSRFWPELVILL